MGCHAAASQRRCLHLGRLAATASPGRVSRSWSLTRPAHITAVNAGRLATEVTQPGVGRPAEAAWNRAERVRPCSRDKPYNFKYLSSCMRLL